MWCEGRPVKQNGLKRDRNSVEDELICGLGIKELEHGQKEQVRQEHRNNIYTAIAEKQ